MATPSSSDDAGSARTAPMHGVQRGDTPALPKLWVIICFCVLYGAAAYSSRLLILDPEALVPPIWLADGLALAVFILFPARNQLPLYAAMLIAALVDAVVANTPLSVAGVIVGASLLQVWIALFYLRRFAGLDLRVATRQLTWRAFLELFAVAVVGSSIVAAAVQSISLYALSGVTWTTTFMTYFASDALGMAVVTPLVLTWARHVLAKQRGWVDAPSKTQGGISEGVLAFLLLVLSAGYVFSATPADGPLLARPFVFMTLPALVWIAMRFEVRIATLGLGVLSAIAIGYTIMGRGPFGHETTFSQSAFELQLFLIVAAFISIAIASLVSEQRLANADLVRLQQGFDAAMHASGQVVFEVDLDKQVLHWVGDVQRVIGWPGDEINDFAKWTAKVHPEDRHRLDTVRDSMFDAAGNPAQATISYRFAQRDGSYIRLGITAYGTLLDDPRLRIRRRFTVGLVSNITESFALTERSRRLEWSLRQSQKLETIGQLAGSIAHDFNNILAATVGYAEMIKDRIEAQKLQRLEGSDLLRVVRYADTILRASHRGQKLVAQILAFSRRAPETREPVNLNDLLSEVVALVGGSHARLVVLSQEEVLVIDGDATALHQVIMNVCTNGLQAMKQREVSDAVLHISLAAVDITSTPTDSTRVLVPGRYALIRVQDSGTGMSADVMAQMFDPFFTTKPLGEGTGLGLALAAAVTHAHDGALLCASEEGVGTTISIYLPLSSSAWAASAEDSGIAAEPTTGHGERIMVVDDDSPLRGLAAELLTDLGYAPAIFASSVEAWNAFNATPNDWHLLLTDEVMPNLSGTQLAERVRALRPDLPIIMISAYGGSEFQVRAAQAGVAQVLKKPYRSAELARVIARELAARQPSA